MKRYSFETSLKDYKDLVTRIEATDGKNRRLGQKGWHQAAETITKQTAKGGKIMFFGNGGSAAIASHQATDYSKNGGVRAMAFNDASLLTCLSNDYAYAEAFERAILRFADPGDVAVAISSSGKSPNIIKGAGAALKNKCRLITLSGFDANNPLRSLGDVNFYVPSHSYYYVENLHLLILTLILDAHAASHKVVTK